MIIICQLTTVHPRSDTRIFLKESKTLAEQLPFKVVMMVADGQGNINQENNGVSIHDLGHLGENRIKRAFVGSWRALNSVRKIKPALVHFHDPELIPLCLILKVLGHKVIYDVHEDVPRQTINKHYLPMIIRKPISWVIGAVEWVGAKAFNAIVPATPKIAKRFPVHKTVTVQNFPIPDELLCGEPAPYLKRPASFAYVGAISKIRGAEEILCALALFGDTYPVILELAGNISPYKFYEKLKMLPGWKLVQYHGIASRKQIACILTKVRAGLVILHPISNYLDDSYPVKMFEYMSVGIPVIASDFPLWRRIIEGARCGLLVDPMKPEVIAETMRWILEHPAEAEAMGQRGRKAVEQIYNWNIESLKLISLYKKLLAQ
jgi:glycosyltransferase involved in cell wall biosynthesis